MHAQRPEMARKVSLTVTDGKSEEEVKKKMGATYLYCAGRMTNQEWFKIQMGVDVSARPQAAPKKDLPHA